MSLAWPSDLRSLRFTNRGRTKKNEAITNVATNIVKENKAIRLVEGMFWCSQILSSIVNCFGKLCVLAFHHPAEQHIDAQSRQEITSEQLAVYVKMLLNINIHLFCSCSICLEDNKVNVQSLGCGHTFHTTCLTLLAGHGSKLCPNCRKPFDL